ncbi:Trp operon leader peptide [Vibrio sp. RE86]|nr:Trp operon leader peptide [Vibrio sp. RE86]NOH80538.1 Trp operon leader peptide [Vibrio sp. RE86]
MLQDIQAKQKAKVSINTSSSHTTELAWWRTWTSSWWANVYF